MSYYADNMRKWNVFSLVCQSAYHFNKNRCCTRAKRTTLTYLWSFEARFNFWIEINVKRTIPVSFSTPLCSFNQCHSVNMEHISLEDLKVRFEAKNESGFNLFGFISIKYYELMSIQIKGPFLHMYVFPCTILVHRTYRNHYLVTKFS